METIVMICDRSREHRQSLLVRSRREARVKVLLSGWKRLDVAGIDSQGEEIWRYICPSCVRREKEQRLYRTPGA